MVSLTTRDYEFSGRFQAIQDSIAFIKYILLTFYVNLCHFTISYCHRLFRISGIWWQKYIIFWKEVWLICQKSNKLQLTQKMKLNVNSTYFKNSRPQHPSSRPLTLTALIVELAWRCRRRWKESPGFGGVMIAADVSTL